MIKNIFWNFIGNLFSIIINIGLVPLYIRYLGVEEYAIVSILGILNSIFVILDLGLGISINREIARMSAINDSVTNFSNTVKTLQTINLSTGLIIFLITYILSDIIGSHWFISKNLSHELIIHSIKLIGLILLFRWPISFYSNILIGFQKIPLLNYIKIIFFIIQGLFTIILLVNFKIQLINFLIFLVVFYFIYFLTIAFFVWKIKLLNFFEGRFKKEILINLKKFMLGVSIISLLGVFFPIIDKFFVSKIFSLETYGYYVILNSIGFGVTQLVYPITSALFPNFTKLYFQKKNNASFFEFRFSFQLVGSLVISFLSIFYLYSQEILFVWTHNNTVYEAIKINILPFLIGLYFYTFQIIPSLCVTATGMTIKLRNNLIFTFLIYSFLLIISINYSTLEYISYSWMVSNMILFMLNIKLITVIEFRKNILKYIFIDIFYPTLAAIIFIIILKYYAYKLNNGNLFFFICQLSIAFFILFILLLQFNYVLKKRIYNTIKLNL
jgi:O-antigen/teichoic acid export membrane protein